MKKLGVIVGRGGSKRLPGKALRALGGHPLIGWSTRAAIASCLDRVIISTDDSDIAAAAENYGAEVPFLRPSELARDNVGNDAVLNHALEWIINTEKAYFDVAVLVQPTAPFVLPEDINACISRVLEQRAASCFTVVESRIAPEAMFRNGPDGFAKPAVSEFWFSESKKKSLLPPAYKPNGAIWAVVSNVFLKTKDTYSAPYCIVTMPRERSIDIDFENDLVVAEALREANGFKITKGLAIR